MNTEWNEVVYQHLLEASRRAVTGPGWRQSAQKDLDEGNGKPEYLRAVQEALDEWRKRQK